MLPMEANIKGKAKKTFDAPPALQSRQQCYPSTLRFAADKPFAGPDANIAGKAFPLLPFLDITGLRNRQMIQACSTSKQVAYAWEIVAKTSSVLAVQRREYRANQALMSS